MLLSQDLDLPKRSHRFSHLFGKERRAATTQKAVSASGIYRLRYATPPRPRRGTRRRISSGVNRRKIRALPGGISSNEKECWTYSNAGRYAHFLLAASLQHQATAIAAARAALSSSSSSSLPQTGSTSPLSIFIKTLLNTPICA